jgi:hypothetical protein
MKPYLKTNYSFKKKLLGCSSSKPVLPKPKKEKGNNKMNINVSLEDLQFF